MPCPATATFQVNTPFQTNGGGNGPEIVVTGFDTKCVVDDIKTSIFVTTATDLSKHVDPAIGFFLLGRVISFDLIEPKAQGFALSGPSLGTACFNNEYSGTGGDIKTASPPYVGTFKPKGDCCGGPTGNFDDFKGLAVNGTWELPFYRLDETMTVVCWKIDFFLVRAP